MPYADPEKQREAKRESYRRIYAADKAFREAEAARKAEWLQTPEGSLSNYEATLRHREKTKPKKPAKMKPKL